MMKANKQIGFIYKDNESIDKILKDGEVVFERGFLREKTSTTLPITFDGVGKDLKDYRVYGNTVQSKLPDGYTQVDYIESSGTQYINTNILPTNTIKVEIKYQIKIVQNTYVSVFGSRDNNVNFFVNNGGGNTITYYWHGTGSAIARIGNFSQTTFNISTMDALNGLVKNYNNETEEELSETVSFTSFPNLPMYIFARNNDGMPSYATLGMKCWYMKIYDNNVLVRDFIPCYRNSDNEVGLYDLVNNVFYTNQGTGVFTYGSVAPTPDTPIDMVSCGDRTKNLFDGEYEIGGYDISTGEKAVNAYQYRNKNFIEVKPNTEYTFSLNNIKITETPRYFYYDKNKNKLSSEVVNGNFTTPNNCYFLNWNSSALKTNYPDGLTKPMIEEGSTATPYEPYGYKIPVNVRSENLLNTLNISETTVSTVTYKSENGLITLNGVSFNKSIELKTGLNEPLNGQYTVIFKKVSGNIINNSNVVNHRFSLGNVENTTAGSPVGRLLSDLFNSTTDVIVATGTINDVLDKISIYINPNCTFDNYTFQLYLVKGTYTTSNLPEYQPYYNETTNIYLDEPLRRNNDGTYKDYIDFKNKKIYRQIKEITLNGTETWSRVGAKNGAYRFRSNFPDVAIGANSVLYCTHFKNNGDSYAFEGISGSANIQIYIRWDSLFTTVEDLTIWLASNKPTVDYALATPTEESITLPSIPTIDGNNTLNIETEITPSQVYIKYKSNI